jgi:hypothetical protein
VPGRIIALRDVYCPMSDPATGKRTVKYSRSGDCPMKRSLQPAWPLHLMAWVLAQSVLPLSLARGEAAPKPKNDVVVSVTYQEEPLADAHFEATLLELVGPGGRRQREAAPDRGRWATMGTRQL